MLLVLEVIVVMMIYLEEDTKTSKIPRVSMIYQAAPLCSDLATLDGLFYEFWPTKRTRWRLVLQHSL